MIEHTSSVTKIIIAMGNRMDVGVTFISFTFTN